MSNLAITGVEVSQAVQYFQSSFPLCGTPAARTPCADNSIPLVAGKATAVRAYLSGAPPGSLVLGISSYTDAGSHQQFIFSMQGGLIPAGSPKREVATDGVTFLIPSQDAYAGNAVLHISTYIQTFAGPSSTTASATVNLAFAPRAQLLIRLVRVHYQSATLDIPAPTLPFFWSLVPYMRSIYPVSATEIALIVDSVEKCDAARPQFFDNLAPGAAGAGTTGTLFHILDQLAAAEAFEQNVVYLALYPLDLYNDLLAPGFSGAGGGLRAVICGDPNATPTFAHEVGHALGLAHAPAGGAGGPDPNYPSYAPLPSGSIGETGFDGVTGDAKDPAVSFDFMSYAGPPWISPYHYRKLYDTIGPPPRASLPRLDPPPRELAYLTVRRLLDRNTIVVLPGWIIPGPFPPISEIGEFRIELLDRNGRSLAQTNFDIPSRPRSNATDEINWRPLALPWYEGAERLRVSRNGKVVVNRRIEPKPPRLTGTFPAGELLGGKAAVQWSSSPATARVMLRYSADGGDTWTAISTDRTDRKARSVSVDLDQLPGGDRCCFELLASVDLRTTIMRSEFFRVALKTPRPLMISPRRTRSVRGPAPVELSAAVTNRGDPDSLVWTSSLDGELGRGPYLLITDLSVGEHRIGLHFGAPDDRSVYRQLRVSGGDGR
jgi:hypothetical protein